MDSTEFYPTIEALFKALRKELDKTNVKHECFTNEELQQMLLEENVHVLYSKKLNAFYFGV
jgi:hypothetical protein